MNNIQVLCESLSGKSKEHYATCVESFNEVTVEKLKSTTADELCKKQQLCSQKQKKGEIFRSINLVLIRGFFILFGFNFVLIWSFSFLF